MKRLLGLFLFLALVVIIPFLAWGDGIEHALTTLSSDEWTRRFGSWAWAVGMLLLMADLVLPIPATAVMTTLGILYGPFVGGLLAAIGSFSAGSIGYLLCRTLGRPAAAKVFGERGLEEGEQLFSRIGGWIVVFSRWLPVFPEVIAYMAGLTRMPPIAFFAALACGSIPFGFAFAVLGHAGVERPLLAIGLSVLVPPAIWVVVQPSVRRKQSPKN